jgi:hypothetical protein
VKYCSLSQKHDMCVLSIVIIVLLTGCLAQLPFQCPFEGYITDCVTGNPIPGGSVEASWWCHDNPLPDVTGSFFIQSSAVSDRKDFSRIEKETRRWGFFGTSFALTVKSEGYIPARLIFDPS